MPLQEDDFVVKAHDAFDEHKLERSSTTNTDRRSTVSSRLPPNEKFPNVDEKKVLSKMDWHILPFVSILYLLAYLDRGNVGYATFEVPSNVILKLTKPSLYIPIIMICWGLVMTLMGIVQNYMGLFWARFFLGVAEAGLFPAVAYNLTSWYCRHEYQLRVSLFYSAASIAGAFSGILAFGISKMDGVGGLEGWRWIFILEGILTVVVAFFAFYFIHNYPDTASFLTEEERQFVLYRLAHDNNSDTLEGMEDHNSSFFEAEVKQQGWKYFKQALFDWQIYGHVLIYYSIVAPTYGVSLFLPTIILNLGYTSAHAQLMSIPIYVCASIISVITAYCADRVGKRSPFIIGCLLLMVVGFSVAIGSDPVTKPGAIYAGVFILTSGMYAGFPSVIAWLANNLSGDYKRAIGMAMQIGLGNLGGAFGSNIYRAKDKPHFILGHAVALGFVGLGLISTTVMATTYYFINRKRERDIIEGKYKHYSGKQLAEMGDKNPYFRYRI